MKLLAFLIAALLAHSSIAQVSSPYFPSQVGWSWTYIDYAGNELESAIVEPSTIMGYQVNVRRNLTQGVDSYFSINQDGDVLYHGAFDGNGGSYFDPPIVVWKAGASLGSTWTSSSQAFCDPLGLDPVGPVRSYTRTVVAAGNVEVPAGEFEAIQVQSTQSIGCSGDNQLGYSYSWLAAGVGLVQADTPSLPFGPVLLLVSWHEPQVSAEQPTWGTVKAMYR